MPQEGGSRPRTNPTRNRRHGEACAAASQPPCGPLFLHMTYPCYPVSMVNCTCLAQKRPQSRRRCSYHSTSRRARRGYTPAREQPGKQVGGPPQPHPSQHHSVEPTTTSHNKLLAICSNKRLPGSLAVGGQRHLQSTASLTGCYATISLAEGQTEPAVYLYLSPSTSTHHCTLKGGRGRILAHNLPNKPHYLRVLPLKFAYLCLADEPTA